MPAKLLVQEAIHRIVHFLCFVGSVLFEVHSLVRCQSDLAADLLLVAYKYEAFPLFHLKNLLQPHFLITLMLSENSVVLTHFL